MIPIPVIDCSGCHLNDGSGSCSPENCHKVEAFWEQRRFELAKAALQGFCSKNYILLDKQDDGYLCKRAFQCADKMVKLLRTESPLNSD